MRLGCTPWRIIPSLSRGAGLYHHPNQRAKSLVFARHLDVRRVVSEDPTRASPLKGPNLVGFLLIVHCYIPWIFTKNNLDPSGVTLPPPYPCGAGWGGVDWLTKPGRGFLIGPPEEALYYPRGVSFVPWSLGVSSI